MSKRLLLFACAGALISASCSEPPSGTIDFGDGQGFVPYVADFLDDVGLGNALAVDTDGVPFVSYWGFTAELQPGGLPTSRPIGSPFLPAVLVSSEKDGIFTRGAAAHVRDTPTGVTIPYGPDTVDSLGSARADNTNGTDIAIDASGGKHVAWAADSGIWYANGTTAFAAELITGTERTPRLNRAGPLGWPSVAVDAEGTPWIAFTVSSGDGLDVSVSTPGEEGWTTQVVATTDPCAGCDRAPRTQVVITDTGPLVLYVDEAAAWVMAALNDGENGWVSFPVEPGVSGAGLSAQVGGDGTILAAYYSGSGAVHVASSSDGTSWEVAAAADVSDDANLEGDPGATTGIASTDDGTQYLTWHDPATESVLLASAAGGPAAAFEPMNTGAATEGGTSPAVAVAADGSKIFLTWYDTSGQDLMLGVWGPLDDLVVAAPSPTTEPGPPAPPSDCGDDGQIMLDAVALGTAFTTNCLVAPAGEPFTINFDNQDPVASTGPHNIVITAEGSTEALFSGELIDGPAQVQYDVPALDEGAYPFNCQVHPVMVGTLAVVAGGGGGGGGNDGGGASGSTGATGP